MSLSREQIQGCLFGLALGDALGAPYEGGMLERLLWKIIGSTKEGYAKWTDDTQMTLDLLESILEIGHLDEQHLANKFAHSYRWRRGYGAGTAKILKRIKAGESFQTAAKAVYPNGSYGNGAAMRSSVLALIYKDKQALIEATTKTAHITHAHPLAVEGALLISLSTHFLLKQLSPPAILLELIAYIKQPSLIQRLDVINDWLTTNYLATPKEIIGLLGHGMTAESSCPTALYVAFSHLHQPFEQMLSLIIQCGGDVDTIAAMAGTLWGTANGYKQLPKTIIEDYQRLLSVAEGVEKFVR